MLIGEFLRKGNYLHTVVYITLRKTGKVSKPYKKDVISLNEISQVYDIPLFLATARNNDKDWTKNTEILKHYEINRKIWEDARDVYFEYLQTKYPEKQYVEMFIAYAVKTTSTRPALDFDNPIYMNHEYVLKSMKETFYILSSTKRLFKTFPEIINGMAPYNTKYGKDGDVELQGEENWAFIRTDEVVHNPDLPPLQIDLKEFEKSFPLFFKTPSSTSLSKLSNISTTDISPPFPVEREIAEQILEVIAKDPTYNQQHLWNNIAYVLLLHFPQDIAFELFRDFSMTIDANSNQQKFLVENWEQGGTDYNHFYSLSPRGTKTFKSLIYYAYNIDEETTRKIFPSFSPNNSFEDYTKEEHPHQFEQMMKYGKLMMEEFSHETVAQLFSVSSYACRHKYDEVEKKWYSVLPNNVWYAHPDAVDIHLQISTVAKPFIRNKIQQLFQDYKSLEIQNNENDKIQEREKFKKMKDILKFIDKLKTYLIHLGNFPFLTSVAKLLKTKLKHNGFWLLLDTNTNLFACSDFVFDLTICNWRPIQPEDYISITTNYKLPEVKTEILKEVIDFWDDIFLTQEESRYHQLTKASAMFGGPKAQSFYVLTGEGENGKGVDEQLTSKLFGDYYCDMNPCAITKPQQSANEHSDWPRTKGKKYIHFGEPNQDAVLQNDILKKMTGEDDISARRIYGDNISWYNQGIIFLICNSIPRPALDEKAFRRRVKIINFPFLFQDKEQIDKAPEEEKKYLKLKNYELKTKFRTNPEYAQQAMLHLLNLYLTFLQHNPKIPIPERFAEKQLNYLTEGNPVLSFVLENYDIDETETHKISSEILRTQYNQSLYGKKRPLNKSQFPTYLKDHVKKRRQSAGVFYFLKKGGLNKEIWNMENMENSQNQTTNTEVSNTHPLNILM